MTLISNIISVSTSLYPSRLFQHVILSLGYVFAILVVFILKLACLKSAQNHSTIPVCMVTTGQPADIATFAKLATRVPKHTKIQAQILHYV